MAAVSSLVGNKQDGSVFHANVEARPLSATAGRAGEVVVSQIAYAAAAPLEVENINAQSLVSRASRVNAKDAEGNTTLHRAIRKRREQGVIAQLLNMGADPNSQNLVGDTPLHLVGRNLNSNPAVVSLLLKAGARIDIANNAGEYALKAVLNDAPWDTTVERLIDIDPELNATAEKGFRNLLVMIQRDAREMRATSLADFRRTHFIR